MSLISCTLAPVRKGKVINGPCRLCSDLLSSMTTPCLSSDLRRQAVFMTVPCSVSAYRLIPVSGARKYMAPLRQSMSSRMTFPFPTRVSKICWVQSLRIPRRSTNVTRTSSMQSKGVSGVLERSIDQSRGSLLVHTLVFYWSRRKRSQIPSACNCQT